MPLTKKRRDEIKRITGDTAQTRLAWIYEDDRARRELRDWDGKKRKYRSLGMFDQPRPEPIKGRKK